MHPLHVSNPDQLNTKYHKLSYTESSISVVAILLVDAFVSKAWIRYKIAYFCYLNQLCACFISSRLLNNIKPVTCREYRWVPLKVFTQLKITLAALSHKRRTEITFNAALAVHESVTVIHLVTTTSSSSMIL